MAGRRKKAISDPDTCVCGRERENLEERKLLHCRACSRASSAAYRARHSTRLAIKDRVRRRFARAVMISAGEGGQALREARDATLVRVWIHRGLISREPCACGREGRPIMADRGRRLVLWRCALCAGAVPEARPDLEVREIVDEQPMHVAPTELVLERSTILGAIDALPDQARSDILERVRLRRPPSVPALLWRETSVMWKDVAIAVYREIVSEPPSA